MPLFKKEAPVQYVTAPAPRAPVNMNVHEHNMEMRMGSLESKLRKCDEDLALYKREMQRLKPGSPQYEMYKQRAFRVLKQKRVYQKQFEQTGKQQFNMDQMKFAKEQVQDAQASVSMMKDANKAMQKDMNNIDLDEVEDLHDEMEEMLMDASAITDTLGRTYDLGDGITDADLEAELDNVEAELFVGAGAGVPSYIQPSYVPVAGSAQAAGSNAQHANMDPIAQLEAAQFGGSGQRR
ncbi:Charged multivesicular body protein 5 [Porphyridium purpureum]|uniref:Charged multivesicular body protein 5 n=1 Tax=Porphyridium purpureum TaxID=35688 RepID=A0A5J4Z641_PORPP|nr:Charged multivesicular body protein 5 [Porphyridium purpureum]|eukprot:POR1425..scf295_1